LQKIESILKVNPQFIFPLTSKNQHCDAQACYSPAGFIQSGLKVLQINHYSAFCFSATPIAFRTNVREVVEKIFFQVPPCCPSVMENIT
jgi:hypothetical protein